MPIENKLTIGIDVQIYRWLTVPIETKQPLTRASRIEPLFNNQRNTNKDGTASTATGDQIAPKGYQREAHLDG
jgi:hypothetical protein